MFELHQSIVDIQDRRRERELQSVDQSRQRKYSHYSKTMQQRSIDKKYLNKRENWALVIKLGMSKSHFYQDD